MGLNRMAFHNSALARLVPDGNYRAADLARIEAALTEHQTLTFVRLSSGLYSASSAGESIASAGYANVKVRDDWENRLGYFSVKGVSIPVAVSSFPDEIDLCPRSWRSARIPI